MGEVFPSDNYTLENVCKVLLNVLTCCSYMGASWCLIVTNRFLMTEDGFEFPMILCGMGTLFTWISTSILVCMPSVVPMQQKIGLRPFLTKIVPLGLCSAGTMALGMIAGGIVITTASVGAWFFEWERFQAQGAWARVLAHPQWYIVAASLGFFLNFTTYAVIQLTGSMTQKILATLKGCAMVGISVLFMGDAVSLRQLLGYMISIMGFSWYRYLNHTVHKKDKQE